MEKRGFVGNDVGDLDGGKESDFIEGVVFLSGVEFGEFDNFHGEHVGVLLPFDFDDASEAAGAELPDNLKFVHNR